MKADISIDGHGFYSIVGLTAKGRKFMTRVQGNKHMVKLIAMTHG